MKLNLGTELIGSNGNYIPKYICVPMLMTENYNRTTVIEIAI